MRSRRMPNLFIVGAPKCGTSTMAKWLSEHPSVYMSTPKEPHYFNADLKNQLFTDEKRYLSLFNAARCDESILGEASTWYLYSRAAIPAIESFVAEPRYIVMTRDPVEMVRSLYLHNVRHLHEDAPSLEQAWRLQPVRRKGDRVPSGCREPAFLQYAEACALGQQLERMLQVVSPARVLHVRLADLREDPALQYRRVLDFLALTDDLRQSFDPENEARLPRNETLQRVLLQGGRLRRSLGIRKGFGLVRLNERRAEKEGLSRELEVEIRTCFEEDQPRLTQAVRQLDAF